MRQRENNVRGITGTRNETAKTDTHTHTLKHILKLSKLLPKITFPSCQIATPQMGTKSLLLCISLYCYVTNYLRFSS